MSDLTGAPQRRAETSCADAWLGGQYATIRLSENVHAVRVQVSAGVAAPGRDRLATGAGIPGRWFAVGDIILTHSANTSARTPGGFSKIEWYVLKAGSVVNVGLRHPMFGHVDGGEQVELVSGPEPEREAGEGGWNEGRRD